jgi:hypothetical protein
VSARSALTEGSDRDRFCSHSPRSAVEYRSRKRSAQAKRSLRVANLSKELKDCCCRCAQSRSIQTVESI